MFWALSSDQSIESLHSSLAVFLEVSLLQHSRFSHLSTSNEV